MKPTIEEVTTAAKVIKYLIENSTTSSVLVVGKDSGTGVYTVNVSDNAIREDRLGVALLVAVNRVDDSNR